MTVHEQVTVTGAPPKPRTPPPHRTDKEDGTLPAGFLVQMRIPAYANYIDAKGDNLDALCKTLLRHASGSCIWG
jgi:hypothetical protein